MCKKHFNPYNGIFVRSARTFVKFIYVMMRGVDSRPDRVRLRQGEAGMLASRRERRSTIILAEGGGTLPVSPSQRALLDTISEEEPG